MTLLAYRFALDPTPAQERALRSHAGAARVAFNWGLARVKAVMDQRAAEATYGITSGDLAPSISWSLYALRKDWNAAKEKAAPWWAQCSKEAFSTGLDQLARALKNWAGFPQGHAERQTGRVPPVQVQADGPPVDPVHDRRVPLRGPACGAAADRPGEAARARREAG